MGYGEMGYGEMGYGEMGYREIGYGWTDQRTDGRTKPLIEMRGRI